MRSLHELDPHAMLLTLLAQRQEIERSDLRTVEILERAADVLAGNVGSHSPDVLAYVIAPALTYVLGPFHLEEPDGA